VIGRANRDLLLAALREPTSLGRLDVAAWAELLPAARRAGVLARLAYLTSEPAIGDALPPRVRTLLASARPAAEQHGRVVRWEVGRLRQALAGLDMRIVLLKGAAYVCAGLPAARGRLTSDVDILVPRARLADVERALLEQGFRSTKLHPYDQRFYRKWAHELPPLRHARRRSVVDVHHTILPLTGRLHPDPEKLLAAAEPLEPPDLWILAAEDLILHSATHLFQDGDLGGGLRDLVDLDALLRDFGERRPGFWARLAPRARELSLTRPLYYGVRFCRALLRTPVPDATWREIESGGRPPWPLPLVMDALALRALCPDRDDRKTRGAAFARLALYMRSHWLRMPPWLLIYHLTRKALRSWASAEREAKA
jgi:putative nucleotidyltransferase-like protein